MLRTAESTIRSFIRCIGLWMPGVSKRTIWPSGRLTTARMRLRVVCGLSETMATFWPTIWLTRVDLPTFGRPTMATKPATSPLVLRRLRGGSARGGPACARRPRPPPRTRGSPSSRPAAGCGRRPRPPARRPSPRRRRPAWPRAPAPAGPRSPGPRPGSAPSASMLMGSASRSYSSLISPTISSTMSSTVTRPEMLPYSSMARAKVMRRAWNSFSSSATFLVSGTR